MNQQGKYSTTCIHFRNPLLTLILGDFSYGTCTSWKQWPYAIWRWFFREKSVNEKNHLDYKHLLVCNQYRVYIWFTTRIFFLNNSMVLNRFLLFFYVRLIEILDQLRYLLSFQFIMHLLFYSKYTLIKCLYFLLTDGHKK